MPFDDLSRRIDSLTITERLAALKITTIDPALIHTHRLKMIRANTMRSQPLAEWRERDIDRLDTLAQVDQFVSTLPRSSSAPTAVIDIAQRIRTNMPEALFRLHYFYHDPYLSVRLPASTYHDGGIAYIGLWLSRRRLLAIAHDPDDRPAWCQKLYSRLVG